VWVVAQFHWDPASYLSLMHEEVPDYEQLQNETAAAVGAGAQRVLELGTGTGETARRVLAANPTAHLIGIDASSEMLVWATSALPAQRVELREGSLEDALPAGPFDVVVSALAIHHLDAAGKADLFARVSGVLAPGGRVVIADVIVPADPADAVTPIDDGYDMPSTIADQLRWLQDAGLSARVSWSRRDLAVLIGQSPTGD
jgi:tRNA (cmo5U34)-methyltransferase